MRANSIEAQNIRRRRVVDIFEYFILKASVAEAGVFNGDSSCRVVQGEDDGETGRGDRNVVMIISVTGDDMDETGDAGDDVDDTGETGDDIDSSDIESGEIARDDIDDADSGDIGDADIGDTSGDLVAFAERKVDT